MTKSEIRALIRQLKKPDHAAMAQAVIALRERGWLTDGTLRDVFLVGAKLNGARLVGADLVKASLSQSDLSQADLSRANLSAANLRGANLSGAVLFAANLTEANLQHANLSSSNLHRANFMKTSLDEADMTNAALWNTTLNDVDLSTVRGLETVRHFGPTSVGIDTLYRSNGHIPDAFLRGCGLPEDFIAYGKSLIGKAVDFFSCFISYSHNDQAFARRLHDSLQGRGIRCWLDEHQMKPGDDIYAEVDRGIRLWDKVLLCCSKHSLTSWWVDNEINKAFAKERELMKAREHKVLALIPLDLDGYLFNDDYQNGKKSEIHTRLAADFKGWEHDNSIFEHEFERVVKALRTDSSKEPPPQPKL